MPSSGNVSGILASGTQLGTMGFKTCESPYRLVHYISRTDTQANSEECAQTANTRGIRASRCVIAEGA